jgi:predicted DNA-binding transcriptional regulator YafY
MKADRLLSALLLLQIHGRLTGRELAERLEVSPRTVHRYMEELSSAGVPVYALRGRNGGWQLAEGWSTQVPGLDEAEVRALLMAQPRLVSGGRLAAAAQSALDKLMAAMPPELRRRASSMRARLHVDTAGWWGGSEDLSALPTVEDAVSRDRKLRMTYRPKGREAGERRVDPLGLVAKGSVWYLVASTPRGLRTYRISRIEAAQVMEEPCQRPAGFDLAAYWRTSLEELRRSRPRLSVKLRTTPESARTLAAWQEVEVVGPEDPDDAESRVVLWTDFEDAEHARFVLLGLGPRAEVLEPDELRRGLRDEMRAALELWR